LGGFGLICAADSGLDTLASWDVEPQLIVGDMDSISSRALLDRYPRARLIIAPRAKDETDTELGLAALEHGGAARIVLAGGGGGRLDHLLAIRAIFERRAGPRPSEWHTAREAVYLVEEGGSISLEAAPNSTVSVFPLAAGARGMSSAGLAWPLEGLAWGPGDCGVSNVAVEGSFCVGVGRGELLVVLSLEADEGRG
jgi:thiamine pyrophosphokinase